MTTELINPDDNHEHDEMLSIEEAAALLRVPVATMRYWRYCGDGPHSFRLGRHVRYWRTDLIIWRADQGRRPDVALPQNQQPPRSPESDQRGAANRASRADGRNLGRR